MIKDMVYFHVDNNEIVIITSKSGFFIKEQDLRINQGWMFLGYM